MEQILDEIRCLRGASSSIRSEMTDMIDLLLRQEEEMMRFELSKSARTERAGYRRCRTRMVPEGPPPNRHIYDRATEADKFIENVVQANKDVSQKLLRMDKGSTVWIRRDTKPDGTLDGGNIADIDGQPSPDGDLCKPGKCGLAARSGDENLCL